MKLLVCSFLLLVILEEYNCKPHFTHAILKAIGRNDKHHRTYILPVYVPVAPLQYPLNSFNPYNRHPSYPSNYGQNNGPVDDGIWRGNSYQGQYSYLQPPAYNSFQNGLPNAINSLYGNPSSTNVTPYFTNGTPNQFNGSPYSANPNQINVNNTPYSTNPNQVNNTPYSTNPNQVNNTPYSTNPNQVNSTPYSTNLNQVNGTPYSTNPNQVNRTPYSTNGTPNGISATQQSWSNVIPSTTPSVKVV
ncbi:sporozoite surface protein 2-like [Helicoverpa zea]|uniref:sporozoite surface protein 2-like n=1 Tax=Helicoverpa zea TaxID=7113 RepID=UPI001F5AE523|nr:sporozoite surface protein 2-like [Helicoverpa zea]